MDCALMKTLTFFTGLLLIFEIHEGKILHSCDFENDLCGWGSKPNETANWKRTSFDDKSVNFTFMDHTTGSGHYIYMESEPGMEILAAILVSPIFTFDGENCLSLWYYTNDNFCKAHLFVFQKYKNHTLPKEVTLLIQRESTFQGWRRVQADITPKAAYWIEIYGSLDTVGNILGVDDITVGDGTCPKEYIPDGYIGCYDDNMTTMTMLSKSHTNNGEECRRRCKFQNNKYAGTRKSECYCGNILDDLIPGTACNMSCPGNELEICGGGIWSRSLYTTMSIKTESDEFSLFGLDKSTLLVYVFLSASSCALITAVIAVIIGIVIKRKRARTSRTLNTKTMQPALLELNTNERQPEHVINDDDASPYNYISLDTVNTPGDDNYSTVAIDKTTQRNVHSRKKPQLTTIVNNTYGRVQDIITDTVEKDMDQICDIIPDTSTDEDFQPADGYLSLNHYKTNENKTSYESASENDKSIQSPGFYESFVERKPAEYSEVHLDMSGKCCILENERDKDKATEVDNKETEECHDYYILEKH